MYDLFQGPAGCDEITTRTSQKYSDANGLFSFDFVLAGVPFTIAALDTGGLTLDAINTIMNHPLEIASRPRNRRPWPQERTRWGRQAGRTWLKQRARWKAWTERAGR